jgi:hypothetical protein
LMGSGSLEPAFASGVPSIMSEKATRTNDTATFFVSAWLFLLWENATLAGGLGSARNIAPVPALNALPLPLFRRARKLFYWVKKIRNLNLILLRRLFPTKELPDIPFVRTNVHFGCK